MAFATDNFNGGTAANRGTNWTSVTGFRTALVADEASANAGGDPALEYYNALVPSSGAQYAEITLRGTIENLAGGPYGAGPAVRIQTGADTGYVVVCNTQAAERFRVFRRIAGIFGAAIITYTGATPAAGDRVGLYIDAAYGLTLYVNDVPVATFDDAAAGNKISGGRVGDFGVAGNVLQKWDDWDGGDNIPAVPDVGFLLLANGTDRLLLANGTDRFLLAGGAASGTQYPQTVTGTITSGQIAGGAVLQVRVLKAGTVTSGQQAGGLTRRAGKVVAGTHVQASTAGALARRAGKALAGVQATMGGAIAAAKLKLQAVGSTHAQASTSGTVTKRAGKGLASTHLQGSSSGTITRRAGKVLAGTQGTIGGTIARTLVKLLDVSGTLTSGQASGAVAASIRRVLAVGSTHAQGSSSGALTRRVSRLLAGTLGAGNGGLTKRAARALASTVTAVQIAGAVARLMVKLVAVTGTLGSPSGGLLKRIGKPVSGGLTPGPGTVTKRVGKAPGSTVLAAQIAGAVVAGRKFLRSVAGTVTSVQIAGALARRLAWVRSLAGTLTPGPGTLTKQTRKTLTGTVQPTGGAATYQSVDVAGTMASPSGALTKRLLRALTGTTAPGDGTIGRQVRVSVTLTGTLAAGSGTLGQVVDTTLLLYYDRVAIVPDTIARVAMTPDTLLHRRVIVPDTIVAGQRITEGTP